MSRKLFSGANLLLMLTILTAGLALTACNQTRASGTTLKPDARRVRATWVAAEKQAENIITLPASLVREKVIVHFPLETDKGKMPFMAYEFNGGLYVRANICPPCRSYNFSLENGLLVCDTCGTRFDAGTGEGVDGACVSYPKASVVWETEGENLTLKTGDLETAYANTLKPGLP